MMCYWCWKKGHKASDCGRRKAGHSKSPKPGSSTTPASNGGGGGGSSTENQICTLCNGHHMTKNCYYDKANASKRPPNCTPKNGVKEVGGVALCSSNAFERKDQLSIHKSD